MENIERLFNQEVKSKKRIGSNIFSRASTRKGGSNQALRTPYFYMSQKERKKLNGEVKVVLNMNEIISYEDFKGRDFRERKNLMTFWRSKYKTADIKKGMGVSSNTFYRLLTELGIKLEDRRPSNKTMVSLTEEELEKYMNSEELIDFELFKSIDSTENKDAIVSAYLGRYQSISDLSENWKGSSSSYLYNIRSKAKALRERQLNEENEKNTATDLKYSANKEEESQNNLIVESEKVDKTPDSTNEIIKEDKHTSNIELNTNTFSFNLKGEFNAKTIKRRLELALEVLEDEEELLVLDIAISNKK